MDLYACPRCGAMTTGADVTKHDRFHEWIDRLAKVVGADLRERVDPEALTLLERVVELESDDAAAAAAGITLQEWPDTPSDPLTADDPTPAPPFQGHL